MVVKIVVYEALTALFDTTSTIAVTKITAINSNPDNGEIVEPAKPAKYPETAAMAKPNISIIIITKMDNIKLTIGE
jgi:hypothetical protein